jgi:transcriptional regulator with GAF, ATPase, and Fis domain
MLLVSFSYGTPGGPRLLRPTHPKRHLILRAFEEAEQNHTAAARLLDVHPNYLHRLVRDFDLRRR